MTLDEVSYGVKWDDNDSSPLLTRIGNMSMHRSLPILSLYKGCVVKDGKLLYWLSPDDWNYKMGGVVAPNISDVAVLPDERVQIRIQNEGIPAPLTYTEASTLDGTDGDVCVYIPKFYGKSGTEGTEHWVRISESKVDDTWLEIPAMYMDAYRAATHNEDGVFKTASVVNTTKAYKGGTYVGSDASDTFLETDIFKTGFCKPRTNIAILSMRKGAIANKSELLCYEFYKWVFYWNYVIEYANFNCQDTFDSALTTEGFRLGGLGKGVTTLSNDDWRYYNGSKPITTCGYGNSLGNRTGIKTLSIPESTNDDYVIKAHTFDMPRWRGFDNPFGDIYTVLEGIIIKYDSDKKLSAVYTTDKTESFTSNIEDKTLIGYQSSVNGYAEKFDLGEHGNIIPSAVNTTTSTFIGNVNYAVTRSTLRTLYTGGCCVDLGDATLGLFASDSNIANISMYLSYRALKRVK